MKKKPIIFTVLSILCFIEPLIKVLYFKAITHFDFVVILSNLREKNSFMDVVDFWLIFPIAGMLILKLRKWTYFAFLSVITYIVYNILTYERYTWPYNSESPFMYHYVVALMCLSVFLFFLSPKVREPFFERRARMWETKTRYLVDMSCTLQSSTLSFSTQIMNISKTGAFIEHSPYIKVGDVVVMEFNFLGESVQVPVKVVHEYASKTKTGFGVEFMFKTFKQSIQMAKVIHVIQKSHAIFKNTRLNLVA